MSVLNNDQLEAVALPVFSWRAEPDNVFHVRPIETIAKRLAYVLMQPEFVPDGKEVDYKDGAAVVSGTVANLGIPVRNQLNMLQVEWSDEPFFVTLRETDSFGEVLVLLEPVKGQATAYSITIDRTMKGGVSFASPQPEDQFIHRIGRFSFDPVPAGKHELAVKAVEADISISIDGNLVLSFQDPDIAAGCFGIGSPSSVRVYSCDQIEYITEEESRWRDEYLRKMNEFCAQLDAEYDADVAANNSLKIDGDRLTWIYPETQATVELTASPGALNCEMHAGLYGNPRMLVGLFAQPEITDASGEVFRIVEDEKPTLEGDDLHFTATIPLKSDSGKSASLAFTALFTENALWFCTAEISGVDVQSATLAFGLDRDFEPLWNIAGIAGEPAKLGFGPSSLITDGQTTDPTRIAFGMNVQESDDGMPSSFICTDGVTGHVWKALSDHDTRMQLRQVSGQPALVLHSNRSRFRWALMWMPYHKLNVNAYKKRMLHFIRQPETPYSEYRERPSVHHYPTDEELERYAANGVRAMVWHHVWVGNNSRRREGFVVNEKEMARAMKKSHELGMEVIGYIGIVPGRHPVLRYEDLGRRMFYDKNWDLQDFVLYSVAGRFAEFLPYYTDYMCREYGLDGYYTDGGFALLDWGYTGLSEEQTGMSLEELNNRLYSRVKRVLRKNNAGFGLENWGGAPIHLAGPWYDCRMIGETFQEREPRHYRDGYNPLLTSTPFKMYGMDLTARNRYNIAMSAVCLTDIQICSGNYSWGCWPDAPSDWANLRPFWSVMESIDWDNLIDAKPWWAQKMVEGDGFYAGHYTTPKGVVLFLANRKEEVSHLQVQINIDQLPEGLRSGRIRPIYPEAGDFRALGDGTLEVDLPNLHNGPVGFEIVE